MRKNYLAYGSNLNIRQMIFRCQSAEVVGISEIKDYRLLFKGSGSGAYLTIEPHKGGRVPVAVWSVTDADIKSLDRYEGYPKFYYRKEMKVEVNGKKLPAFVYIMHEERALGICTDRYFETCLEGYEDFGFDCGFLYEADAWSRERMELNEE